MTFLFRRLAVLISQRETRANMRALFRYLAFLGLLITVYSGCSTSSCSTWRGASWVTGFYLALVVYTLGSAT